MELYFKAENVGEELNVANFKPYVYLKDTKEARPALMFKPEGTEEGVLNLTFSEAELKRFVASAEMLLILYTEARKDEALKAAYNPKAGLFARYEAIKEAQKREAELERIEDLKEIKAFVKGTEEQFNKCFCTVVKALKADGVAVNIYLDEELRDNGEDFLFFLFTYNKIEAKLTRDEVLRPYFEELKEAAFITNISKRNAKACEEVARTEKAQKDLIEKIGRALEAAKALALKEFKAFAAEIENLINSRTFFDLEERINQKADLLNRLFSTEKEARRALGIGPREEAELAAFNALATSFKR